MFEGTSRQGASTPPRTRSPSPPLKHDIIPALAPAISPSSLLAPPSLSLTAPTPQPSPISPTRPSQHRKAATDPQTSILRVPTTPPQSSSSSRGKRKADEAEVEGGGTPPKDTNQAHTTFAITPRPHRASANSNSTHAPSSYHRKRAKLSATPELHPASVASDDNARPQNARTTGSWSSRVSKSSSRLTSHKPPPSSVQPQPPQRSPSRRSFSQASIPVSALISPHAPSIIASSSFHMRDPYKPSPIQSTPWSLAFASGKREPGEGWRGWAERGGSPLHAWLFFIGFLIFPVWWVASFIGIHKTRRLGENEQEKGVLLDDPQVEFDAQSWRKRCRVMGIVSFLTYIPFIILVGIFA